MKPYGTIYKSGKPPKGEVSLEWPGFVRFLYHFAKSAGAGVIGFIVISVLFTYGPVLREEISYTLDPPKTAASSEPEIDTVQFVKAVETGEVQKQAESFGVNSQFSIVIPEIGAAENIIANVDAGNKKEYQEALKIGVAHAKATYFPGQDKTIFLFAHSTDSALNISRYNAVFYLLRKLNKGDKVYVFFSDKLYEYEVDHKQVTEASDVSWLIEKGEGERLILQTCDPPGTTWKRLIVVAKPTKS